MVFRRNFKKHKDSDTDVCHIAASRSSPGKYNTIARLFELMKIISDDQLLILLKDLLKDSLTNHIFKLIIDMTDEQQALLSEYLETSASTNDRNERRGHFRKLCLIPVDYKVQGRVFDGYILDISAFGVFIETYDYFFGGQEIIMAFSVPNYQKPLKLAVKSFWSSQH